MSAFVPELQIREIDDRVRLGLRGFSYVEAGSLQEAADALVQKMLAIAMAFRARGPGPIYAGYTLDPEALAFIWNLGEIAAAGGDIRDSLFGSGRPSG